MLIEKSCVCGKEQKVKTLCHKSDLEVSCGKICGIKLPCGHNCDKICHDHEKYLEDFNLTCRQPCKKIRSDCGHICGQRCHGTKNCDLTQICKVQVKVTCPCKYQMKVLSCGAPGTDNSELYSYNLMRNRQMNQMASMGSNRGSSSSSSGIVALLCDDACSKHQRIIGLKEALAISDNRHDCVYEEWMISFAKNNLPFVQEVENIFANLIAQMKDSTNSFAEHQFKPMKKSQRTLIHQLAALYGLEGKSYDAEPFRYCHIFTSIRSSSLPKILLSQSMNGEAGRANNTDNEMVLREAARMVKELDEEEWYY